MFSSLIFAAGSDGNSWAGLLRFLQRIGEFLLVIAPGLIVLSFMMSAFMWVMAGHSRRLADRAKDQFKATCVVTVVIGGYWLIRGLSTGLSIGSFG